MNSPSHHNMDSKNTLLVYISDPDPFLVRVYKHKFEALGWQSIIIEDASEIITHIQQDTPHGVVMDIILPGNNGFTVLEEIRTLPNKEHAQVPVIFVTDLAQSADKEKALNLGASLYLVKSENSFEDIVEKISKLLT